MCQQDHTIQSVLMKQVHMLTVSKDVTLSNSESAEKNNTLDETSMRINEIIQILNDRYLL